ncbi:rhombosortase [Lentisalinibacter orientalis]|uniref:rhombosortase n=1 Tax=Lentisalinibacter orientalis TaxID=2992241 RepID=UPI00386CD42E
MGLRTGNSADGWWDSFGGAKVPFAVLACAALAAAAAGDGGAAALRYSRAAVADGEWWRLATGHLVHLGAGHLLLNLAGLALVGWLTGREYGATGWWLVAGVSAAAISAALYLLHPGVAWYVGLSGVLHGLLAGGLVPALRRRDTAMMILAALLAGKLAWEAMAGPLPGAEQTAGGPVLVEAHRYGALGGVLAGLGALVRSRRSRTAQTL